MSEPASEIRLAVLGTIAEFERCVELQVEVWGYQEADLFSRKVFIVASRIGGMAIGAFDGERMIGFVVGLPGIRNGYAYLHSHMMGVLPEYRNAGIGRRLKLAQRDEALARGIELIEWTFDPLEIKNGYLNIAKLGAITRRYVRNFYGNSSSPLQGGLPTDRLYAEWWLKSYRVKVVLADETPTMDVTEMVEVSGEIYSWKARETERDRAVAVQTRNREALESAFASGLAVLGYERDVTTGTGRFLLGRWNEKWAY